MPPLRIALVGLGRIALSDHLPAIRTCAEVMLDAACDPDPDARKQSGLEGRVPTYPSVELLLRDRRPDAAIVAVPHHEYLGVIRQLAAAGVHVLKEKPFAVTLDEAAELDRIVRAAGIALMVSRPRRFNPLFLAYSRRRHRIGREFYFEYRYVLNVGALDRGWRAQRHLAGGGCLIDMGYHAVDLLVWFFGIPSTVHATVATGNRDGQVYDVEDSCSLQLRYDDREGGTVFGTVFVSRVFPTKQESFLVAGTRGVIEIDRSRVARTTTAGSVVDHVDESAARSHAARDQLHAFARLVHRTEKRPRVDCSEHFAQVAIIEAAYLSAVEHRPISPQSLIDHHGLRANDA